MPTRALCLVCAPLLVGCPDYRFDRIDDDPNGGGERQLRVDPESIDFGEVPGGEPVVDHFTITSTGTAAVTLEPLHVHGSGAFTLLGDSLEGALQPGEVRSVEVLYTPATPDDHAQVEVESDATVPRITVDISGAAVMPDLVFDPPFVLLQSFDGGKVIGSFIARNDGLADLVVQSWVLQGERFDATTTLPGTLGPGEETEIEVSWTPAGEMDEYGYFWAASNDPGGDEVATLEGLYRLPCLGLHEATTRGQARITGDYAGIKVHHRGEDLDICIDRWYVYISDDTQDAGAGDPAYRPDDVYGEDGSIELAPGDTVTFEYGDVEGPAWWCVEQTQMTAETDSFHFTGAQVPPMLLDTMLGGSADPNGQVWQDLADNPVVIVGRARGWVETVAGGTTHVEIEATNMGRQPASAEVSETIPAGLTAEDFDPEPDREEWAEDGSVTVTWSLSFDAAIDTDSALQTIYDTEILAYTLGVSEEACQARISTPAPTAVWQDAAGQTQQSAGSPLIVECW